MFNYSFPDNFSKRLADIPAITKQEYQDSYDLNVVEGVFGTCKSAYVLGRISVRHRRGPIADESAKTSVLLI